MKLLRYLLVILPACYSSHYTNNDPLTDYSSDSGVSMDSTPVLDSSLGSVDEGPVYLCPYQETEEVSCLGQAEGFVCRPSRGPCDADDVCDGVSDVCPTDGLVADGEICCRGACFEGLCRLPL